MALPIHILYCHCAYAQVVPQPVKAAVLRALCASGIAFEAVADLCELSARRAPALRRLAEGRPLKIAACHPRAVKWLFAAAQAPLATDQTELINMRTLTAEAAAAALARAELEPNLPAGKSAEATPGPASFPDQEPQLAPRLVLYEGPGTQPLAAEERCAIMAGLLEKGWAVTRTSDPTEVGHALPPFRLMLGQFNGAEVSPLLDEADRPPRHDLSGLKAAQVPGLVADWHARNQIPQPGAWLPWFPVIDFDRCTHCMQCLSFCLFEVFGVDEHHRIRTQHPANCKTHCPACSRLCPEAAIIFPKYQGGPISGEDFGEGLPGRDAMKIDISALLGGDVYSLLRDRNARSRVRFSKDRDAQQALAERRRCLAQAARMADIPPEVLMALPTPAEIQRRTEEAKAKAQEALHRKEKPA